MTMTEPDIFDAIREDEAVEVLQRLGYTVLAPNIKPLHQPELRKGRARRGDRATSIAGAESVAYRAGSQKARLLEIYAQVADGIADEVFHDHALTDEECARLAGLSETCYWKRCGELREDSLIEWLYDGSGEIVTRLGWSGVDRGVCRITPAGRHTLSSMQV